MSNVLGRVGLRRGSFGVLVAFGLAACAGIGGNANGPCPRVSVLTDAASVTQFRDGAGQDLIDIVFEAEIDEISPSCTYNRGGTEITATTALRIIVTRGPASSESEGTFLFFVAVVDDAQRVLARERFASTLVLGRSERRAGVVEEIEEVIPLPAGQSGINYEILIGFELTDAQLAYNRRRAAR